MNRSFLSTLLAVSLLLACEGRSRVVRAAPVPANSSVGEGMAGGFDSAGGHGLLGDDDHGGAGNVTSVGSAGCPGGASGTASSMGGTGAPVVAGVGQPTDCWTRAVPLPCSSSPGTLRGVRRYRFGELEFS